MQGQFETGEDFDKQPTTTDEGYTIASFALNGEGTPILTLTDEEVDDLTTTVTVDGVTKTYRRTTTWEEIFTLDAA